MNKYVWELYLKSGGKELVAFFEDNIKNEMTQDYAQKIHELQKAYCVSENILSETLEDLKCCISVINEKHFVLDKDENDDVYYNKVIDDEMSGLWRRYTENDKSNKNAFSDFIDEIEYCTTFYAYFFMIA